jgi:hypothetical protein
MTLHTNRLDLGGNGDGSPIPITGVADPVNPNDAANKQSVTASATYAVPAATGVTTADIGKLMMEQGGFADVYAPTPAVTGTAASFSITVNQVSTLGGSSSGPVSWDNLTNFTASGSELTKTSPGGWDSLAYSNASTTGVISVSGVVPTGFSTMLGLSEVLTPASYTAIHFAISTDGAPTSYRIYEQGTFITSPGVPVAPGDVVSVASDGTNVVYSVNGATVYTSSQSPAGLNLHPIAASYETGISLTSATVVISTPATAYTLTSPIDAGSPFTVTVGPSWTPGASTSLDAAALAGAMSSAFTGWTASSSANVVNLSHNTVGANPSATLVFNNVPAGGSSVTTVSTGSNAIPAFSSNTALGILMDVVGGNALVSLSGGACSFTTTSVVKGDAMTGDTGGQLKKRDPANDVKLGVALYSAPTGAKACMRYYQP